MGLETLFVQLSAIFAEIEYRFFSNRGITIIRVTFCRLSNIVKRFLRICSDLETLIKNLFLRSYPPIPTMFQVS